MPLLLLTAFGATRRTPLTARDRPNGVGVILDGPLRRVVARRVERSLSRRHGDVDPAPLAVEFDLSVGGATRPLSPSSRGASTSRVIGRSGRHSAAAERPSAAGEAKEDQSPTAQATHDR